MKKNVAADMRNQAMKKLFADPHYNVMDGLDIYISDYTKSDPIPLDMLRKMTQSKALFLFEEEEKAEAKAKAEAEALARAKVGSGADFPPSANIDFEQDAPPPLPTTPTSLTETDCAATLPANCEITVDANLMNQSTPRSA